MGRVSDAKARLLEAVRELIWTGSYGRTTIDQICEKAGVKKGSFYYFFESKAELAEASLNLEVEQARPLWDGMFSPAVPPLERLARMCDRICEEQAEKRAQFGKVLGCPLFALGAEVCTQETRLREKIQEICELWRKYLESAVRDAVAAGLIAPVDAPATAQVLFAYSEGLMTHARIQNSLDGLTTMYAGCLQILGVKPPAAPTV
jgi:TetR/AcrR family transcriptional repressor of nem operon